MVRFSTPEQPKKDSSSTSSSQKSNGPKSLFKFGPNGPQLDLDFNFLKKYNARDAQNFVSWFDQALFQEWKAFLDLAKRVPPGFGHFYPNKDKEWDEEDEKKGGGGPDKDPENSGPPGMGLLGAGVLGYMAYRLYSSATGGSWRPDAAVPEITLQEMLNELLKPGYVEKLQVVNKEYCRVFVRRTAGHSSGDGQSMQGTGAYGGVGVGTSSQQQQKRDPEYVIQLGPLDTFEFRVEHFQKMLGISSENYVPIQYTTESQEDTGNTVVAATLQWTMSVAMTIVLPMFILSRVMGRMRGGGMGGPGGGKGGGLGGMFGGMGQEKKKWEQTSTLRFKDVAGLQQ